MSTTEIIVQPTWTEIAERLSAEHKILSDFMRRQINFEPHEQHIITIEIKEKLRHFKPVLEELRELLQLNNKTWSTNYESDHWLERRFDAILIRRLFERAQSVFDLCTGDVRTFVPLLIAIDLIVQIIADYDNVDDDPTDVLRERFVLTECNSRYRLLMRYFAGSMQAAFKYEKSPTGFSADFQYIMGEFDTVRDLIDHLKELHGKLNTDTSSPATLHAEAYQLGGLIHLDWMKLRVNSCTPFNDVVLGATEQFSRILALTFSRLETLEQRLADRLFVLPDGKRKRLTN
jgi:hypothetical protein